MAAKVNGINGPFNEVELRLSARNLQDKDLFSDSDPFCVVYTKEQRSTEFVEVDRTERVSKNLNPDFIKTFKFEYYPDEEQEIKIEVYDADSTSEKLSKHDYLGEVYCTLKEIVDSRRLERPIDYKGHTKRDRGTMIICIEDVGDCEDLVTLQFQANALDKMDIFGKSDPYLTFHRINRDKSLTMVHRTEVVKKTLNPTWHPFTIPIKSLCCNDPNKKIIVNCWDWNKTGSDDYIGECEFTLNELIEIEKTDSTGNTYKFIDLFKRDKDKKYENSGFLTPVTCFIEKKHSPIDFIRNGCKVQFLIAINPNTFTSHDCHCDEIFTALSPCMEHYDDSKTYRIVGPESKTSKDESSEPSRWRCTGMEEVLKLYREDVQANDVGQSFVVADVLKNAQQIAAEEPDKLCYFVLLVLTDITDTTTLAPTEKTSVQNDNNLPLSTIRISVGDIEPSVRQEMASLENTPSAKEEATNDKVHCVHLERFVGLDNHLTSGARLAKEVFAKFPDDFMGWMSQHNAVPKRLQQYGNV